MHGSRQFPMPILAREPACFPEDLFDSLWHDRGDSDSCWWLLYTRSRREKDLMRRLVAQNVPFFCPLIGRRTRSPSGRIQESHVPLFPGYVFLHGGEDERRVSLATNCVSRTMPILDQDRLTAELSRIRQLIDSDVAIMPEDRLGPGVEVRVTSGPLRGQEGIVIERRGRRRLLVAVDLLQRGASVDLDECDVERI